MEFEQFGTPDNGEDLNTLHPGDADPAGAEHTQTAAEQEGEQQAGDASPDAADVESTAHVKKPDAVPDHIYKAARKRAESEYKRNIQLRDAEFARRCAGKTNPITGKPITTEKEYWDAIDATEAKEAKDRLAQSGIDPDVLEQLVAHGVASNPDVIKAQQIAQRMEAEEQVRQQETGRQMLNDQLAQIKRIDPEITSLADIQKMESFSAFDGYVRQNGLSLVDAFRLANADKLAQKRAAASKQAAINNVAGKSHMTATGGVAEGEDGVTDAQISAMRDFYPDRSRKQLVELCKKARNL